MALKKELKMSEARIIIFLKNADLTNRFARQMMSKLMIDYGYLLRILQGMTEKNWLKKTVNHNKVFYELTEEAPYNDAVTVFTPGQKTIAQSAAIVERIQTERP